MSDAPFEIARLTAEVAAPPTSRPRPAFVSTWTDKGSRSGRTRMSRAAAADTATAHAPTQTEPTKELRHER